MKHLSLLVVTLLTIVLIRPLSAHPSPGVVTHPTESARLLPMRPNTVPAFASVPAEPDERTDTSHATAGQQASISGISPRRAAIRSLILPGLGQCYNRQYWKVPVIYTSLGVAITVYQWNSRLYNQNLAGYQEAYNATTLTPPFGTKTAIVRGKVLPIQQLKRNTDHFRRQRDLTVILTVLGWALNAVEANVAAHLKTFDVSDDLSLRIEPRMLAVPGIGVVPGIRLALTH